MKKLIPIYALQIILICTVAFTLRRLTQHLAVIEQQLATMPRAASGRMARDEPILRVHVVNDPDVNVSGTVEVRVTNEPLNVEVKNGSLDAVPVEVQP